MLCLELGNRAPGLTTWANETESRRRRPAAHLLLALERALAQLTSRFAEPELCKEDVVICIIRGDGHGCWGFPRYEGGVTRGVMTTHGQDRVIG